jgi:hypothetical protein
MYETAEPGAGPHGHGGAISAACFAEPTRPKNAELVSAMTARSLIVRGKMKAIAAVLLLFAGCASVAIPGAQFPGWTWRETGMREFRVFVGEATGNKAEVAMRYAALLTLQRGYRAFQIVEDAGCGESGTWFSWSDGYDPSPPGFWHFEPGKYFDIRCRSTRSLRTERWFAAERFAQTKLNQPPEATTTSFTAPASSSTEVRRDQGAGDRADGSLGSP